VALISDAWRLMPPNEARCAPLGAGLLHISFAAETGGRFRVEASSDLRNWETLFDAIAADGAVDFVDDEMTNQSQRFYRVAAEPAAAAAE
jgi:hypothetical protein